MKYFNNYIGGEWRKPCGEQYAPNTNPANMDETLGMFPLSAESDVDAAVNAAGEAAGEWGAMSPIERGKILYRFADRLEANAKELATILTKEQGKPLTESLGEVGRGATEARFMAGEASRLAGETLPSERPGIWVQRVRQPLGVVAAITPWNFPIVTPVRKIAPALACGDTVVFKPASDTPWTAVRLVELLAEAGVPVGVVNLVMGKGSAIGNRISLNPLVRGVTFTGSTEIGTALYEIVAKRLGRVQLELGGKNVAVVLDAPSVAQAAAEIVSAAFACSGQRCTAISRVFVSKRETNELVQEILGLVERVQVGNGLEEGISMGPLVNKAQLDRVKHYVALAQEQGEELLAGGRSIEGKGNGFFYEPTVVKLSSANSPLARDEIFGPVLPIVEIDSIDEAIALCNDNVYGLAASIFTQNTEAAMAFADKAQVGMVHVNHGTASQAHVPFGGVKGSGQGAYSIGSTAKDFYMADKVVYLKP